MPRKRRRAKVRLPSGLSEISALEQLQWAVCGPIIAYHIENSIRASITIWPDWETWAQFYGAVRDEYLTWRRCHPSAAERLYEAVLDGEDPDALYEGLSRERVLSDPRETLRQNE